MGEMELVLLLASALPIGSVKWVNQNSSGIMATMISSAEYWRQHKSRGKKQVGGRCPVGHASLERAATMG